MNFSLTQGFQKKAQKLCKKDVQLRHALAKQFLLFQENHQHPSLRLHKLKGKRSEQHAIWIIGDLRALGIKNNEEYVFFDLLKFYPFSTPPHAPSLQVAGVGWALLVCAFAQEFFRVSLAFQ